MNLASFRINRDEFDDIILMNLATDGQEDLVKNDLLKSVYNGQTNKKWYSDSTMPIEQRRHFLF